MYKQRVSMVVLSLEVLVKVTQLSTPSLHHPAKALHILSLPVPPQSHHHSTFPTGTGVCGLSGCCSSSVVVVVEVEVGMGLTCGGGLK